MRSTRMALGPVLPVAPFPTVPITMSRRFVHIDAAKVVASHLIVLHHFATYGPLADALHGEWPEGSDWLFGYARMAVQVFLVIGGYFAASSLAPHGLFQRDYPWRGIVQRWVRLVPPFAAAMLLAMACSAIARQWLDADFIPAAPALGQLLAHLGLAHGVLGVEPLSAGIWYVAIDFQLFALMSFVLWVGGARAKTLVFLLMLASLFVFNRLPRWDNWAPYFFGAYAMGAFAWWAGHSRHAGRWMTLLALCGLAALLWDWRLRIALALGLALWLGIARRRLAKGTWRLQWPVWLEQTVRVLGRSSYALFLVHFAVLMLANATWSEWLEDAGLDPLEMLAGAWLACVGVALAFERWVERPLARLQLPQGQPRQPAPAPREAGGPVSAQRSKQNLAYRPRQT